MQNTTPQDDVQNVAALDKTFGVTEETMPAEWKIPLEEVPMSVRLKNILRIYGKVMDSYYPECAPFLQKVADLRRIDPEDLSKQRNCGQKSIDELREITADYKCSLMDGWNSEETATQTLLNTGLTIEDIQERKTRANAINGFVNNIIAEMLQSENVTMKLPVEINGKATDIFQQLSENGFNVEYAVTLTRKNPDQPKNE